MKWRTALVIAYGTFALTGADIDDKCQVCGSGVADPGDEPTGSTNFWAAAKGVMGIVSSFVRLLPDDPPGKIAASTIGVLFDGAKDMEQISKFDTAILGKIPAHSSAWQTWKLESTLKTMQDYLVCQFKSLLGQYFGAYFDNKVLDDFNTAFTYYQAKYIKQCSMRGCLNHTNVEPELRPYPCCSSVGQDNDMCEQAMESTPDDVRAGKVLCQYYDVTIQGGVCGTTGKCFNCHGFNEERAFTLGFINQFLDDPDIRANIVLQNSKNFDAMTAVYKATLFLLPIMQQAFLLDSSGLTDSRAQIQNYALSSYQYLKDRYDMMLDTSQIAQAVNQSSYNEIGSKETKCTVTQDLGGTTIDVSSSPTVRVRRACASNHYVVPGPSGCGNCTIENKCFCDESICPQEGQYYHTSSRHPDILTLGKNMCNNIKNTCDVGLKERYDMYIEDATVTLTNETYHLLGDVKTVLDYLENIIQSNISLGLGGYYQNSNYYPAVTCPYCVIVSGDETKFLNCSGENLINSDSPSRRLSSIPISTTLTEEQEKNLSQQISDKIDQIFQAYDRIHF